MSNSILCTKHLISNHSSLILRMVGSLLVALTVYLGLSMFSTEAHAQDWSWEFNLGAGYVGSIDNEWVHESYPLHLDHGFDIMLSAGVRLNRWFSMNFDQSFVRGYERTDINHYNWDAGDDESYKSSFYAKSAFTTKFIYLNSTNSFEAYLLIGAGIKYGARYDSNSHESEKKGKNDPLFGFYFPLGIGMNYYFTKGVGIGLDAQYHTLLFIYGDIVTNLHLAIRF